MKLSEAIRLGSMMKPQSFNSDTDGATCALQAACEALGRPVEDWCELVWEYENLADLEPRCPQCGRAEEFEGVVWHLNDTHRWTRERIADFVEQIENRQTVSVPTEEQHA